MKASPETHIFISNVNFNSKHSSLHCAPESTAHPHGRMMWRIRHQTSHIRKYLNRWNIMETLCSNMEAKTNGTIIKFMRFRPYSMQQLCPADLQRVHSHFWDKTFSAIFKYQGTNIGSLPGMHAPFMLINNHQNATCTSPTNKETDRDDTHFLQLTEQVPQCMIKKLPFESSMCSKMA